MFVQVMAVVAALVGEIVVAMVVGAFVPAVVVGAATVAAALVGVVAVVPELEHAVSTTSTSATTVGAIPRGPWLVRLVIGPMVDRAGEQR